MVMFIAMQIKRISLVLYVENSFISANFYIYGQLFGSNFKLPKLVEVKSRLIVISFLLFSLLS